MTGTAGRQWCPKPEMWNRVDPGVPVPALGGQLLKFCLVGETNSKLSYWLPLFECQ